MAQIRILNGDNNRLRALLGEDLASKIDLQEGDAVVTCEPETEVDWVVGRAIFEKLITQGHTAYAVQEDSNTQIQEWNPTDQDLVIMVGPIAGG